MERLSSRNSGLSATTVWDGFFTAQVGASAALAGLIFVGLSINLTRILALPRVPERGLQTLFILLAVLVVSSLMLVPGQSSTDLGLEVLVVGGIAWAFSTRLDIGNLREIQKGRRFWVQNTLVGQAALLPYIAGGISTLVIGIDGLYWLAVAVAFSYLKAIIDAWVLLIEINR